LRDAAGNPYVDEVRRLLVARANVHSTDALGNTALHRAALNGRLEASQMLLAEGADVDALNHSKRNTPLHMSIINGHWDVSQLLIDAGADVNSTNVDVGRHTLGWREVGLDVL